MCIRILLSVYFVVSFVLKPVTGQPRCVFWNYTLEIEYVYKTLICVYWVCVQCTHACTHWAHTYVTVYTRTENFKLTINYSRLIKNILLHMVSVPCVSCYNTLSHVSYTTCSCSMPHNHSTYIPRNTLLQKFPSIITKS